MRFENTQVFNFDGALRGMRNPKESWSKSDSHWEYDFADDAVEEMQYVIGEADLKLAQTLIRAGSEHRKFMRQIIVSVDITAPMYWFSEFDTYKVGTVANSTSKMHKIQSKPITRDLFELGDFRQELDLIDDVPLGLRVDCFINDLEQLRQLYLSTDKNDPKKKQYWKELIRWLPCGWLQTRTVTMSYENLLAMCSKGQRRFHKLSEWSGTDCVSFVGWARTLPYAQELIFLDELEVKDEDPRDAFMAALEKHCTLGDISHLLEVKLACDKKKISVDKLLELINVQTEREYV